MMGTLHTDIPSAVLELARKAEGVDLRQVMKKAVFNISVIAIALTITIVDLWMILEGQVTTDPGKKLAIFVLFGAGALLLVGLMSLLALFMSALSYQRLGLLLAKEEEREAEEEAVVLVHATAYALLDVMPERPKRQVFLAVLRKKTLFQKRPELADEIEHILVAS